ncbi:MAG: rubrerythrin family protein [Calditrichaeota bacterium]|nr:rubrerythrin family protein [Calditrichota bacterium]
MISEKTKRLIIEFQKIEITEYHVYKALAKRSKGKNREVLNQIADDELKHYQFWEEQTGVKIKPNRLAIWRYLIIERILGLTFTIKMMEKGEEEAEKKYSLVIDEIPEAKAVMEDEIHHEQMLVEMIDERRIEYIGSMVLGLNDALVELTGALAGFTLALQNARLIGMAGLITGVAASLSMAASEYLSKKSEAGGQNPLVASFYTGVAYIFTVTLLIGPFFVFERYYFAMLNTLVFVLLIIWFFSFFVSIVKGLSFKHIFVEMIAISLSVTAISFFIGILARKFLGVEV